MKEFLTLDIQSTVHDNVLIYVIQITHQKYIGGFFTETGNDFTASNGFRLSSQSCPALYKRGNGMQPTQQIKGRRVNGTWTHNIDMMCVRGADYAKYNTRMYTNSIVYIERLKLAVTEYNECMRGD